METKNKNTGHCQVQTVKYNGRDYRVQKDRNGFEYIKVSQGGKRVIIALSTLESKDPIFNYVFNYGFRNNPNPEIDKLARERIYGNEGIKCCCSISRLVLSNPHGSEPRSYSEVSDGVDVTELMGNLRDWVDAEERSFNLNSLIFIEYDNY